MPTDDRVSTTSQNDMPHAGMLLVISGPSGVGKTTITRAITKQFHAQFSISATTRPQTDADIDGTDYTFYDQSTFERMIANHEFLEYARVFEHYYGTPRKAVEQSLSQGRVVILEIDVQGAIQIRKSMPQTFMVFIMPPSEDALLQRLRDRKRESEKIIQRRFSEAKQEMNLAKTSGVYDTFITNDDLDTAIAEVQSRVQKAIARLTHEHDQTRVKPK